MNECQSCNGNGFYHLIGVGLITCDECYGRGLANTATVCLMPSAAQREVGDASDHNPCIELGVD